MAKYIDSEKLKAKIERLGEIDYLDSYDQCVGFYNALDRIENFVNSLQQEYPSIPDNLDEAAEEYSNVHYYETMLVGDLVEGFKAGAKWMAGQGITVTGDTDDEYIRILEDIEEAICEIAPDSTVNIQIRK